MDGRHLRSPRPVAVVGATAAGKSDLAIGLAQRLEQAGAPAEIINADSMQLYRGMDVGTAKPPVDDRGGIVHHLIDVFGLEHAVAVAEVRDLARAVIDDCRQRSVIPIVVGGSALYVHAILDQLDFPPTDPDVRARIAAQAEQLGPVAMHERLRALDPQAASAILVGNTRRIVRALEVIELTGGPFVAELPRPVSHYPGTVHVGVGLDRAQLTDRIERRVEQMWADGLLDEVRGLLDEGLRTAPTASRALGYQQAIDVVDGHRTQADAIAATVVATRQFAKRQLTWFRRDERIEWVAGDAVDRVDRALAIIDSDAGYGDARPAGSALASPDATATNRQMLSGTAGHDNDQR